MVAVPVAGPSALAIRVLSALRDHHNVLVTGPPSTGKTRLLSEVRQWFAPELSGKAPGEAYQSVGPQVFTAKAEPPPEPPEWLPSPERTNRRTWLEVFHQGTKYSDFVNGVRPTVVAGRPAFETRWGVLLEASDHALLTEGAALLVVDEINRGPAVAAFGGALAAMEGDKRLGRDGKPTVQSLSFTVRNNEGADIEYALPFHLYLLAAMNEADTSVETLDVAFRRRFHPVRLSPDDNVIRSAFNLGDAYTPPEQPRTVADTFEAAIHAWQSVNTSISLARGDEFVIGHGIFFSDVAMPGDLDAALRYAVVIWERLFAHASEVFFGDSRALAAVLHATGAADRPFFTEEAIFSGTPVLRVRAPDRVDVTNVYQVLQQVATG